MPWRQSRFVTISMFLLYLYLLSCRIHVGNLRNTASALEDLMSEH